MAEINKPDGMNKIWASAAPGGNSVMPSDSKISQGWIAEKPPFQSENALQNKRDVFNAHINQHGFPTWDSVTEYQANKSYVLHGTTVWKALTTHSDVTPVEGATWTKAFDYVSRAVLADTGVTTSLFDEDTSLATTQFVQRALGNYNNYFFLGSNTNIGLGYIGSTILTNAGLTHSLPALSTCRGGATLVIRNYSASGNVTIIPNGADKIAVNVSNVLSSITIAAGQELVLVATGASDWVCFGSAVDYYNFGFNSGNNHFRLPSGKIVQFGTASDVANAPTTVTFPFAFNNLRSVVISGNQVSAGVQAYVVYNSGNASGFTFSSFYALSGNEPVIDSVAGRVSVSWLAIGD
jgi:hypothetical protein